MKLGKINWYLSAAAGAVLSLGAGAMAASPLDGQAMYGIDATSGHLLRYDGDGKVLHDVGAVRDLAGNQLMGIHGAAYIPGHSNLIGFWTDPADGMTRMVYINLKTGLAGVVGNHLGAGLVSGGTRAQHGDAWKLYVAQRLEAVEVPQISFTIVNDTVVANESYAVKVQVIGAAITSSGKNVPVTTKFVVAGATATPFGSYTDPAKGNVNDGRNPRSHIFPGTFKAGTSINVMAQSWLNGKVYLTGDSSVSSPRIVALRHGDSVPNIKPFENQTSIVDFIRDYVDAATKKVRLDKNQVIYLFELGTTDLNSSAADFQDLVVLVTLAKEPSQLVELATTTMVTQYSSKLMRIDHKTGMGEHLMTLGHWYDGLATLDGQVFYGTAGTELYRIDLAAGTETLVGSLPAGNMTGLEFAGSILMGFEIVGDSLLPINLLTGAAAGSPIVTGARDLGTMVFTPIQLDPAGTPVSFD